MSGSVLLATKFIIKHVVSKMVTYIGLLSVFLLALLRYNVVFYVFIPNLNKILNISVTICLTFKNNN